MVVGVVELGWGYYSVSIFITVLGYYRIRLGLGDWVTGLGLGLGYRVRFTGLGLGLGLGDWVTLIRIKQLI